MLSENGDSSKAGFSYNNYLGKFVEEKWNPDNAINNSASLKCTVTKIKTIRKLLKNQDLCRNPGPS